jgi:hypothetical protein
MDGRLQAHHRRRQRRRLRRRPRVESSMPARPSASAWSIRSCRAEHVCNVRSNSLRPSRHSLSPRCAPTSRRLEADKAGRSTMGCASKQNASAGRSPPRRPSRDCADSTTVITRTVGRALSRSHRVWPARAKPSSKGTGRESTREGRPVGRLDQDQRRRRSFISSVTRTIVMSAYVDRNSAPTCKGRSERLRS